MVSGRRIRLAPIYPVDAIRQNLYSLQERALEARGLLGKTKIGISACLLGEALRYDGGHRRDPFLTDTLGQYVEYVPVCPEVECGLSVPREPMRLVGNPQSPRLMAVRTREDHTDRLCQWASKRIAELRNEDLCGFIFKCNSPSCGMEKVKVYTDHGVSMRGRGIFAGMFMNHFRLVPAEGEVHLHHPNMREDFIARIFVLKRWRESIGSGRKPHVLASFHREHELLLRSHSIEFCRRMEELLSGSRRVPTADLFSRYEAMLVKTSTMKSSVRKNASALYRAAGYLKKDLAKAEFEEVSNRVEQYRKGCAPLVVPVMLIQHYARKYGRDDLTSQVYLNPHPLSLLMRNHA